MKKKVLPLFIICSFLLAGCGSADKNVTTESTTKITSESTTTDSLATEAKTTEISTTETSIDKSFDGLCSYLEDGNYVSGEKSEVYYSMIGASNGCKYLDSNVEIYEFDESSDTYKSIIDTNEVSGLKVYAINGPFILIFSNDASDQSIINAFNNY